MGLRKLFKIVNSFFLCAAAPEIALSYTMKTAFLITSFRISSCHNSQIMAAPGRCLCLSSQRNVYRMSEARVSQEQTCCQEQGWENKENPNQRWETDQKGGWMGGDKPARAWKCREKQESWGSWGQGFDPFLWPGCPWRLPEHPREEKRCTSAQTTNPKSSLIRHSKHLNGIQANLKLRILYKLWSMELCWTSKCDNSTIKPLLNVIHNF